MNEKREQFKTRLGFILIAAGCAVGIGNVWRFLALVHISGDFLLCSELFSTVIVRFSCSYYAYPQ